MSIMKEFREFAIKGNVVDMAVGIIIGAAFTKIVSSAVADLLMPPLGLIIGGADFSHLAVVLREGGGGKPPVLFSYGKFITAVIDFMIVAFAIFLLVKGINSLRRKEAVAPEVPPTKEQMLLAEIRDLIKQKEKAGRVIE